MNDQSQLPKADKGLFDLFVPIIQLQDFFILISWASKMRIIPVGLAEANSMPLNFAIQWKLVVIQPFKADASTSPFHLLVPGNFPIRHAGIKRRLKLNQKWQKKLIVNQPCGIRVFW